MVLLFDGLLSAAPAKRKTRRREAFAIPPDLPGDYTPPEYRSFSGAARIGLDIETHDPDLASQGPGAHRPDGCVVGIAISYSATDARYYPIAHVGAQNMPDEFLRELRRDAAVFDGEIVGANLQYDLDWLAARHNIQFPRAHFLDIQVAEPLLDESRSTYRLDALAQNYLGVGKQNDELLRLYGADFISNMKHVHPAHAAKYAVGDVLLPWQIIDKQLPILESQELLDVFRLESRLTPLLLAMRQAGVRVDTARAEQVLARLKDETTTALAEIRELTGVAADIWAADSIAAAFDALDLDYPRTATGRPSFTRPWLDAHDSHLAGLIVDARAKDKIGSTFVKSYILNNHIAGRIHTLFHQLRTGANGTVTGRFSSSHPNLQNIPIRHPVMGPMMRSLFLPEEGMLWGSLDWSQIEYRLLVHYAAITRGVDASAAVDAYRSDANTDFHALASQITGVERKQAKNINFGIVYGMGVSKLSKTLGVSTEEAKAVMRRFHEAAPFMRGMMEAVSNRADQRGEIRTILGRKRRFTLHEVLPHGEEKMLVPQARLEQVLAEKPPGTRHRRAGTHKALNALLQGSAADLMKAAMVAMWEGGLFDILAPHLTVHDEFNASVPDTSEGREAFEEMRRIMEGTVTLKIPVAASGALGSNWMEAK